MKSEQKLPGLRRGIGIGIAMAAMIAPVQAQVPPDVANQLRALGTGVCVPETAKIYKPLLLEQAPYKGVTVVRDIAYGTDPRTIMDVFAPEKGGGNRPVLIFVSGGAGNKIEAAPDGDVFYDNIMLWAVKNGMTGVNMQRRGGLTGAGMAWDEPAKDVGVVVDWVRKNIPKCKGIPIEFSCGPAPPEMVRSVRTQRIPKFPSQTGQLSKA